MTPVLFTERLWECPNCTTVQRTTEPRPHTRFHACPGLHGLTAPMVQQGMSAKTEVHEREDYVGTELVRLHQGRPVMSVVTTRDDGTDVAVFAPTATARIEVS
jgi:hypothetical protein